MVIIMGRFHVLQEFDEGKRSCRRRLAGHNKRRRKTHLENLVNEGSLNDEKANSYLLISLLRILSNLHCKHIFLSSFCTLLLYAHAGRKCYQSIAGMALTKSKQLLPKKLSIKLKL